MISAKQKNKENKSKDNKKSHKAIKAPQITAWGRIQRSARTANEHWGEYILVQGLPINTLLSQLICTLQLSSQLYHHVHHICIYHLGTTKEPKSPANGTIRVTFRDDVTATPITSPPKTILKASIST